MNRRDLDAITRALKAAKEAPYNAHHAYGWTVAVMAVANAIEAEHANFDRAKFLHRAGLPRCDVASCQQCLSETREKMRDECSNGREC